MTLLRVERCQLLVPTAFQCCNKRLRLSRLMQRMEASDFQSEHIAGCIKNTKTRSATLRLIRFVANRKARGALSILRCRRSPKFQCCSSLTRPETSLPAATGATSSKVSLFASKTMMEASSKRGNHGPAYQPHKWVWPHSRGGLPCIIAPRRHQAPLRSIVDPLRRHVFRILMFGCIKPCSIKVIHATVND